MADIVQYKYRATMYANTNSEYREKTREWARQGAYRIRAKDPEGYNEKHRVYQKDRYNNDPEFRAKKIASIKAYQAKKKAEKLIDETSLNTPNF